MGAAMVYVCVKPGLEPPLLVSARVRSKEQESGMPLVWSPVCSGTQQQCIPSRQPQPLMYPLLWQQDVLGGGLCPFTGDICEVFRAGTASAWLSMQSPSRSISKSASGLVQHLSWHAGYIYIYIARGWSTANPGGFHTSECWEQAKLG